MYEVWSMMSVWNRMYFIIHIAHTHTHIVNMFEHCVFMHSDRNRNLKMRQSSRSKGKFIIDSTSVYGGRILRKFNNIFRSLKCSKCLKCPKCLIPSKWKSPLKCYQHPNKTLDNLFRFFSSTVLKWRIISNICKCFLFFPVFFKKNKNIFLSLRHTSQNATHGFLFDINVKWLK